MSNVKKCADGFNPVDYPFPPETNEDSKKMLENPNNKGKFTVCVASYCPNGTIPVNSNKFVPNSKVDPVVGATGYTCFEQPVVTYTSSGGYVITGSRNPKDGRWQVRGIPGDVNISKIESTNDILETCDGARTNIVSNEDSISFTCNSRIGDSIPVVDKITCNRGILQGYKSSPEMMSHGLCSYNVKSYVLNTT